MPIRYADDRVGFFIDARKNFSALVQMFVLQMQQATQVQMPMPEEMEGEIPPEIENQVAMLAAKAMQGIGAVVLITSRMLTRGLCRQRYILQLLQVVFDFLCHGIQFRFQLFVQAIQ